jgi:uncharacterized RDD family membrane protein YckC
MSSNNYAGFWLRFVAYIIDYIIIQILQSFLIFPLFAMLGFGFATASFNWDFDYMSDEELFALIAAFVGAMGTIIVVSLIIQILYYALMEASKYQATLGKLALGLKVTDLNGEPLDFGRAVLRNIGKIISGMLLFIGYIIAGLTEKKQALHDMIASALVVRK